MFQKSWMLGEIIVFAMLKDEDASFVEIVAIQNEVWNLRQLLQSVWRIGKDKVKLLLAGLQKTENNHHESEYLCLRPTSENIGV